jgi:hypothetical protein
MQPIQALNQESNSNHKQKNSDSPPHQKTFSSLKGNKTDLARQANTPLSF